MTLKRTTVKVAGRKTSIRLERPFWEGLMEIAHAKNVKWGTLVNEIAAEHRADNLCSAIRVYVLGYFQSQSEPLGGDSLQLSNRRHRTTPR